MKESAIEKEARLAVEALGGELLKIKCVGRRGFPDRIALLPGGRIAFIEFKQPGKRPRAEQFRWLHSLRQLDFEAFWTHDAKDVSEWADYAPRR